MSPEEFRLFRAKMGRELHEFAAHFGISIEEVRRFEGMGPAV